MTGIIHPSLPVDLIKPSGLKLTKHIFVADKGDYYEIEDDAEQFADGGTTKASLTSMYSVQIQYFGSSVAI